MDQLKLLALDEEDLAIISAHVQDAIVRVGDMKYVKSDEIFALLLNRFVWDKALSSKQKRQKGERRRTAMHFNQVKNAKVNGIDLQAKDGMLDLLAIIFEETNAPSGNIRLNFAGGGEVLLEVEAIEACLMDLGAAWAAKAVPSHEEEK